MADLKHIENHFETTVEPRILEQYRDSVKWKSCLKAVIDQLQIVEDSAVELSRILDFKTTRPTGERLDWLASLVNLSRIPGENDAEFFTRFVNTLGNNTAGTPDNVISTAAMISGAQKPQYMDEVDATFFVYTGDYPDSNGVWHEGGHQLSRAMVKKMSPAGVMGVPGAAIQFADGSYLTDADGRLILAVAEDDASPFAFDFDWVDDSGNDWATGNGETWAGQSQEG